MSETASGIELLECRRREAVIAAVPALDRLNSWVRSESYRGANGGSREAIYWLKNEAIRALHGLGLTKHRLVRVAVKCRDCGGTGRYVDSWGHEHDHCWACNSSGTARLNFVETTIRDGPTWHSPWLKFPLLRGTVAGSYVPGYEDAVEETDWKPNLPGRDLTPAEVARDLNHTESVFPNRPGRRFTDWGDYDPFDYKLFVGCSARDVCDLCGRPDADGCGYHCTRGRIAWCAYACRACQALHEHEGDGVRIFGLFDLPRSFIDHPDILAWIERHPTKPKPEPRPAPASMPYPPDEPDDTEEDDDDDGIPF